MDVWTQLGFFFLVGPKVLCGDNTNWLIEVQYKLEKEHVFLGEIFVLGWIFIYLFIYEMGNVPCFVKNMFLHDY